MNKITINQSTHCIVGSIPEEMTNVVDLFNTFVCFFYREYCLGISYRHSGYRGHAYVSDIRNISEELIQYCLGKKNIPIGMLAFSQQDIRRFNSKDYSVKYTAVYKNGYPLNPESTFYDIVQLLKIDSLVYEYSKVGVNINVY